jgi:Quinolinate phosphoribosyl transferase, N-terminal domain
MKASQQFPMPEERQRRVEKALFRGGNLTLENPAYLRVLRSLLNAVLVPDLAPRDLTVAALGIKNRRAAAQVLAREPGVAAGLEEYAYLLRHRGVKVTLKKEDGDLF